MNVTINTISTDLTASTENTIIDLIVNPAIYIDSAEIAANTAKTGITESQANDIITNNAKISYSDGAIVSANTNNLNSHTGNTAIHFTQNEISITESQISDYNPTDYLSGATFNTSTGDLTLTMFSGSTIVENLDGRYLTGFTATVNTDDYVTSGAVTGSNLQLTRLSGGTVDIDVSSFLDDTNTDDFTTGATFNDVTGIIEFTRQSGSTFTVDLDGRYALSGTGVYTYSATQRIKPRVGTFTNTADYSTIAGGNGNTVSSIYSTIGGGRDNEANGVYSTVGGGLRNKAENQFSTIAGGIDNTASGSQAFIGGGYKNEVNGFRASIAGGVDNTASGDYSAISGGRLNEVSGSHSFIGGGRNNLATGTYSNIAGGQNNVVNNTGSFIGGGNTNLANGQSSFIGGGYGNTASGTYSVISGGDSNNITASGYYATISGGRLNTASAYHSTIGGGHNNTVSNYYSTIGGGYGNNASNSYSTIGGGNTNTASGSYSTVSGGYSNISRGYTSTISGGYRNEILAFANSSTISGGYSNTVSGSYSTISGGYQNTVSSTYSTIAGGNANTVTHNNSHIIGSNLTSTQANTTFVENLIASGNVGIGTTSPAAKLHISSGNGVNGNCEVIIESDTDNLVETSNPKLILKQDGGAVVGNFGITGWVTDYTNALENATFLGSTGAFPLQLITNNTARISVNGSTGNVGIGTTNPIYKLDVSGTSRVTGILTLDNVANLSNYTVATLPTGVQGDICYVTDASSVTYRGTATGGGSDVVLVFYDGSNWVYH